MSENGLHVHGPHDHEVEHAAHSRDPFTGRIAMMTAIFATIGAFFGYMGGATQNDALLYKNDSAIRRTEASDQWSFYQSKSSKQNLAELGSVLASGPAADKYRSEIARYDQEKKEIMAKAQALEKRSTEMEEMSEAAMDVHHRWAQATTLIQISIALAAITLLTRRRWMQYASYGVAVASVVLGAMAAAHV